MYPVMALVGLLLFTWAAAVWATYVGEENSLELEENSLGDTVSGQQVFKKSA